MTDNQSGAYEVLVEARLVSRRVTMDDGYTSVVVRSQEDAAVRALDALHNAGFEVRRRDERCSCVCGSVEWPWGHKGMAYVALGIVHRLGGPCYVIEDDYEPTAADLADDDAPHANDDSPPLGEVGR